MPRRSANGEDERREPSFGSSGGGDPSDFRLSAADRPTAGSLDSRRQQIASAPDRRIPAEPDDPFEDDPLAARKPKRAPSRRAPPRRRGMGLFGRLVAWGFALAVLLLVAAGGVFAYYGANLPAIQSLEIPKRPPNVRIVDVNGGLIGNRGDMGGAAVALKDLPPYVPQAFVAIEDRRFYNHYGVDPIGLVRAAATNLTSRGVVQGGSTLTQQLAKNLFLTPERSMQRKVQEVVLSLRLEHKYSKKQILELYLNRVYFGAGAYGIDAAAQRYFGKSARNLRLTEAAILAGLVKAPSRLAPTRNPKGARERAEIVLAAMADEGFITAEDAKRAFTVAPPAPTPRNDGSVGYVADWVSEQLDDLVGPFDEDIVVDTTIDLGMQKAAEAALRDSLDKSGGKFGVEQGALVSMDMTGAVKALVGGRDYGDSQFNRAVAAHRQPGSSFKPFVYLTALERGITPDAVRDDAPVSVGGWSPENSDHKYRGGVRLTEALAKSMNTVAVRLAMEVGPAAVIRTAQRLGIASPMQPNASIALGTSEVTPLELVSAYVPFANGGQGVAPFAVKRVRSAAGKVLYERKGSGLGQVIDPMHVGMMNAMLEQTLRIGTGRKAELPGWPAAGKTGTSQDFRDAWFVGYTSALVTGVWLGNDDSRPSKHASGSNLPVEIWSRYMQQALKGAQVAQLPGTDLWAARNADVADSGETPDMPGSAPVYAERADRPIFSSLPPPPRPTKGGLPEFLQKMFGGG